MIGRWLQARAERQAAVTAEAERMIAEHGKLASLYATHLLHPIRARPEQMFNYDVLSEIERIQPSPRRDSDNHRLNRNDDRPDVFGDTVRRWWQV